jgi:GAF domain-containing protein
MMVGEKVVGVIATYHTAQEYAYDDDHQEALSLMASQAAIALDNARLYVQLYPKDCCSEGCKRGGASVGV